MRAVGLALVSAFALGCAGAAAPQPYAMVVGPAPDAGPLLATSERAASATDEVAPFELAFGMNEICARVAGHVHCSRDLDDTVALTSAPPIPGIDDATQLVLGRDFGCVLRRNGTVACFGGNTFGQLGAGLRLPASKVPVTVVGVAGAKRLVAGDMHACALLADATVRCWGHNDHGQTGSATTYLPAARELVTAEPVAGVRDVTSLVASGATTCAKGRAREVVCWGRTLFPLVFSVDGRPQNNAPARVAELTPFDDLAANADSFCGVHDGEISCWGPSASVLKAPAGPSSLLASIDVQRARSVRLGLRHACALLKDGEVTCWGSRTGGALGRGELTGDAIRGPVTVKGLPPIVDLALGEQASCAIGAAPPHETYCWGTWPHSGSDVRRELVPVRIRVTN